MGPSPRAASEEADMNRGLLRTISRAGEDETDKTPGLGRFALRLALGAVAEIRSAAVTEDLEASRRRWVRVGLALSFLETVDRGGEWALHLPREWVRRVRARFGFRWEAALDRFASIGRNEEVAGRRLMRRLTDAGLCRGAEGLAARPETYQLVDQIVGHLAEGQPEVARLVKEITQSLVNDPDVKMLIREQSTTLLGTIINSVRDETARADTAVERVLGAVRHPFKGR